MPWKQAATLPTMRAPGSGGSMRRLLHEAEPMAKRALFLAVYDVASPSRRRQVHLAVKAHASGGQKSVYECFLTPTEHRALSKRARRLIDEREDRFALLRVEERAKSILLGIATPPAGPNFYYVG